MPFPSDSEAGTDGKMTVVCAWCGTILHPGGQRVSHGICNDCARVFERELATVAAAASR